MRKNLSLTAFLMMICVIGLVSTCKGQSFSSSISDSYDEGLILYDSAPFDFYVTLPMDYKPGLKYDPKRLTIEGDTAKAFLYIWEQLDKEKERSAAAEDILRYINIYGHVTDLKSFNEAVNRWKKLIEK